MANKKISELSTSTTYNAASTYVPLVDTSDTSEAASGSNYKASVSEIISRAAAEVSGNYTNLVFVEAKDDFPTPVGGLITLADDTAYFITTTVDLTGDRLVGGTNTMLVGTTSEISILTSTGLGVGVPLFTTTKTTPVQNLTFSGVDTAISIVGTGSEAYDWLGVNFLNCTNVGTVNNIDNFIYFNGAVLNSNNFIFDGACGTIGINQSIFVGTGAASPILDFPATFSASRRMRIIYSSIVAFGSTTGIRMDAGATLNEEGYILDTCNFSGGSTYLAGMDYTYTEARFLENRGITNSSTIGALSMTSNAEPTVIASTSVPVKAAGVTTAGSINQKFTHSDNRLTYTGGIVRGFRITAQASVQAGNNNVVAVYIAVNGSIVTESLQLVIMDSAGTSSPIGVQVALNLATNDYVELWVANESAVTNITVENLNLIVNRI